MVSRVRVPAGARVLDVATGTAAVAVALAARTGASVVGLDQSEPMLRTGVARVQAAGLASRVGFVLGQGQELPFAGGSFDAVTFTYLLRYVDDLAATLAGWSACFESAMEFAARTLKITLPADHAVDAEIDLGPEGGAFSLAARLYVSLPGMERATAQRLVEAAHQVCPYSRATHGNIAVETTLV